MEALRRGRADGHSWFESCFAYDNARLPEALILAGERLQDPDMLSMGLETLELVMKLQTTQARLVRTRRNKLLRHQRR
jgi:hypothetical protein